MKKRSKTNSLDPARPRRKRRQHRRPGELNPDDLKFCATYVKTGSVAEAGRAIGLNYQKQWYDRFKRPEVQALIHQMQTKLQQKVIEKTAEEAALSLQQGDRRVVEVLNSERDPFRGYTDILKAADLCYKRKGGYIQEPSKPTQAILAQSVEIYNERVYEPRWIRKQYGIHDPADEALERELGLSEPIFESSSPRAAEEALETKDPSTGGSES